MALGGGVWLTQNKVLPGSYINFVNTNTGGANLGERGIVAIALPLTNETAGKVVECSNLDFIQKPKEILGEDVPEHTIGVLTEVFKYATKVFIYNTCYYSEPATKGVITITLNTNQTSTGIEITGGTSTVENLSTVKVGSTTSATIKSLFDLQINDVSKDWNTDKAEVIPADATIILTSKKAGLLDTVVKTTFEGVGNVTSISIVDGKEEINISEPTVGDICLGLEPYNFNVLACYTNNTKDKETYVSQIKVWRDNYGKKCQAVIYNANDPDYEGIINVKSTVSDAGADPHSLVAWVSGAEAGCEVNASCTNKKYNGSYTVVCNHSQSDLEECITKGEFVFHLVYGDVRVLEDINSLITTTATKGEDFKSNQTMRVCDQIANDIAKLFNTKYLGVIPNDASGRTSLWADIVKHHRELENLRAIQDFDSSLLTVEQGNHKKAVVINDVVNVVNAMAQLYMTVVIE